MALISNVHERHIADGTVCQLHHTYPRHSQRATEGPSPLWPLLPRP